MSVPAVLMQRSSGPKTTIQYFCFGVILAMLLATSGSAKENPVNAIALFDGPSGPAYVQITGLTLNGKSELRVCDGVPRLNKTAYDGLLRVQLASGTAMERNAEGVLMLSMNAKPVCVVPSNLKFEKNAEFTPAEAAEQAVLQGTVVSASGSNELPAFKRGVRLEFVPAPDEELAQFLLAQRTNSVPAWQSFIDHHGPSAHATDARSALAAIYEDGAESAFAKYQKAGDLAALKHAQKQAVEAGKVFAGYAPAHKLQVRIDKELDSFVELDRAKLQSFRTALAQQSAGYTQLAEAKKNIEEALAVNPEYAPVLNLHNEIVAEARKMESALDKAEAVGATKSYDEALQALGGYRAFAAEVPRIDSIVSAAYTSHFNRGREMAAQHDWDKAVSEFRRATEIKNDRDEAKAALKEAESQLAVTRNREAMQNALARSKEYADNKDFIAAYEVLAELPDAQRAQVTDQLAALQKDYVAAAVRRSQKLQEIHLPIRGRADQDAIQDAYELLSRASGLSGDPALRLKLELLSDKISAYYLDQAKRYLDKPLGSGVGLGWLYLGEAERYKPNQSTVKDTMARYAPAYQLRSRLSIGVVLRDQTSRRESLGFADQLADAIANGLESSGLSIKVVRQPKEGTDAVQPNFLLIGEILEHRVVKDAKLETLQSKYRAGTHEVKNEAWEKANQDYAAAQQQLTAAQRALADAQSQHKKKEIVAAAGDAVTAAQKQVDDSRSRLESTPQTQVQSVTAPYNYTKKNIDLTAMVQLSFRITDSAGSTVEPGVSVPENTQKRFVVLENVKPEDTEGVKTQGTEPDELQFLTDVEIQARDALVKSVREKVLALPGKILQEARNRASQGDTDGAAEEYILYLNATPDAGSHEREEAAKFLHEHYNLGVGGAQQLAASK